MLQDEEWIQIVSIKLTMPGYKLKLLVACTATGVV